MKKRGDPLADRLRRVRGDIDRCLVSDYSAARLETLLKELAVLGDIARRRNRRRSLSWAVGLGAGALSVALLLNLIPMRSTDVSLVASTGALVFESAAMTTNLLVDDVRLRALSVSAADDDTCFDASEAVEPGCVVGSALRLNTLSVNARTALMLRDDEGCLEVYVFSGGASGMLTFSRTRDPQARTVESWEMRQVTLAPGDSLRVCTESESLLRLAGVTAVTAAYRETGGMAEREESPALLSGTLSMLSAAQRRELRRTDVVRLRGLTDSALLARVGDSIDVTVVARADAVRLTSGGAAAEQNLMPSWLDWLSQSRWMKLLLALFTGIVGPVIVWRERFVAETTW